MHRKKIVENGHELACLCDLCLRVLMDIQQAMEWPGGTCRVTRDNWDSFLEQTQISKHLTNGQNQHAEGKRSRKLDKSPIYTTIHSFFPTKTQVLKLRTHCFPNMQNINGQDAETIQGFDFHSFQYEDFPLIPPNDIIVVNSQTAITDNSHTALAMNHLNSQNQESFACWNSSIAGDEIFENFSNLLNLPEQIPVSHPIISEVKFTSDLNKVDDVAVISKEEFIQKDNEEPKKHAAQRNEMHNQTEKNRRNAIKDKINTLRTLLPNCNKTDQASILGDVVDYIKCLQCQHQMLMSMAYMPYMPMGMGMGIVNMCGQFAGGACLPFPSVTLTPTPSLPVFTDSNIVSHSLFKPPSVPLPPVTFDSAQVLPTAINSTFGNNPLVLPRIPYAINHAQQGESSSSQYNGIMEYYNQMYQLQGRN